MELQSGTKMWDLQVNPPGSEGVKYNHNRMKLCTFIEVNHKLYIYEPQLQIVFFLSSITNCN